MGGKATAFFLSLALVAWVLPAPAEAQVAREGILRATISENLARGEAKTIYRLHAGGRATTVVPTGPVTAQSGDRVSVEGALRDGKIVGQVSEEQDLTPQLDLDEPREVAVIGFRFPGDPAQPWSLEQTRQQVFTGASSANAFYQEESYGDISVTGKLSPEGDVFGWYTVNGSSGCAEGTWDAEARAAAEADGKSLAGYDHIVYVFPYRPSCSWLGRASLGGGTVNINGTFGGSQVIAHELGHNLGLLHAGSWSCTKGGKRVSISGSCSVSEYGDPFDVMGNKGTRHSDGWKLYKLGVLSLSENIETVSSGTHTLKAALTPSPAPEVLRMVRPVSGGPIGAVSYYYLEIRERGGFFENFTDASMSGVSIRAVGVGSGTTAETLLIDSTPATSSFFDAPFQVGHTFADGYVHVTVLAAGGGTATVSVGTGLFVDEEEPSAPTGLSASQVGDDVKLQWSASEDNLAVTGYAIFRDGTEIGAGSGTSFTDTSATPGLRSYTVYAEDEAGNRSEASPPAEVTVVEPEGEGGDPEPPPDEGTPPAPVPPSVPPYIPPRAPPAPETKKKTQVKPVFRLRRRSNGAFAFNVDARRNPRVVRVSVWLNGRLLRLTKGRVLRFAWRPGKRRCLRAYRFSARAYERTPAGRVVARIRLRSVRAAKRTRCAGAAG
jgi:hypothetical protein